MYKLTYFDLPGRGEPVRLTFAAAGVKFTDERISLEKWPEVKNSFKWGQLPVLQVGDETLHQSKAICRYLGHKFNLAGTDEYENALCDELVDAMNDTVDAYVDFVWHEQDEAKKEEKKKHFATVTLPKYLNNLNKVHMENGGTWLVGRNMTWADIFIAEYLRQLSEFDAVAVDKYPHVRKLKAAVDSIDEIKEFRKSVGV